MTLTKIPQHPQRIALSNELHARPFPELRTPCQAAHIAIMSEAGPDRDPDEDRAHLRMLLDHYGAQHPAPDASHYAGQIGRVWLKWERHTEFMTYTIFMNGVAERPFAGELFEIFPKAWLTASPGQLLTSAQVRVESVADMAAAEATHLRPMAAHFVAESLSVSTILDGAAMIFGDFRIHESGHVRFGVLAQEDVGPARIGRIVQRMLELETYRAAAMLALPVARNVAGMVDQEDRELSGLVRQMADHEGDDDASLDRLLDMSAEIETLSAQCAFRFGARGAYDAIINQRIQVLREARVGGRQTFGEFMMRRFEPAMRTCESAERRLGELANRTERASNLLRTRVDVGLAQQNRALLESMDRRAALQLRLQETVEGLSIVAISYYAVSLAGYLLAPIGKSVGLDKTYVMALIAIPVIGAVWALVRRTRKALAAD